MHDTRRHELPRETSGASRTGGDAEGVPKLPLGGEAFVSPLNLQPSEDREERRSYRGTVIVLATAVLLSSCAIAVALFVRSQRATAIARAREEAGSVLRAEAASERQAQPASARGARIAATPNTTGTSQQTTPTAVAKGVSSARPHVQPAPVTASEPEQAAKRETERRKTRTSRARSASPPRPSLPARLTRDQVIAAMRAIAPAVHACFGATHGMAKVKFSVVGKTGRVVGARVSGQSGSVGSCIARSVHRARFPKFAKRRIEISYPFVR